MNIFKIVLLLILTIAINPVFSKTDSIVETQKKLNKLEIKIADLEKKLSKANDKKQFLTTELDKTNKNINYYIIKLKKIDQNITIKEEEIKNSQNEINDLNAKLHTMQESMAKYLAARYKLGEKEPLKWLINQDNIQNAERLLTYYKYLVTTNKKLIDDLKSTQDELAVKNAKLDKDLSQLNSLQKQWKKTLRTLNNDKQYQANLISRQGRDIKKKKKTLVSYKENKTDLTKLITSLTKKSVLQTKNPLTKMKKRLNKPINVSSKDLEKMNQGLVFYSPEGTSVQAISSGKVVFSDWLNGYGLLLIVDHGWGFMSLYGNNSSLFKRLGDGVKQGEEIAKVGHSGVLPKNGLYFEIRHHGKAIPPLEWLQ
ncbi:MAG: peptidoglycan DD-metalloendopeptidase family protein [Legionellaceae bacterium]|nr:peptidoglycan DD-metalloendopeptidase family protein [Legionellaceae bacterium]